MSSQTQTFNDSFPGQSNSLPVADSVSFGFDFGVPDVPMPPAGVQYRVALLRIAGQKGLPRDWELAELKIGAGGLILELDGHGANHRTVEPVKAPFHPLPGTFVHVGVFYNALTGDLHVSIGGVTLSGTTALRAGGRAISVTFGVLPGEGGPALTYPHGWTLANVDLGASTSGGGSSDTGHVTPSGGSGGTPPTPASGGGQPASPPVVNSQLSALFAQVLAMFLAQHFAELSPEQQAAGQTLVTATGGK